MDVTEMERRRTVALDALQDAIDALGPITDQSRHSIREPVLEVISGIEAAGSDLKELEFRERSQPSQDG